MGETAHWSDYLVWMLSETQPGEPEGGALAGAVAQTGDAQLVQRLLARDRKAIAEFVAEYSGPLYSYVGFRLAPRNDQTEDVVQEVFLAAWQRLGTFRGDCPLKVWLLGIARHKIEDVYRGRLREHLPLQGDDEPGAVASDDDPLDLALDQQRARERTAEVLKEIPEAHATVLLWRYWERRSTAQIAEATNKTEKAVERLLSRARESFRRRWDSGRR